MKLPFLCPYLMVDLIFILFCVDKDGRVDFRVERSIFLCTFSAIKFMFTWHDSSSLYCILWPAKFWIFDFFLQPMSMVFLNSWICFLTHFKWPILCGTSLLLFAIGNAVALCFFFVHFLSENEIIINKLHLIFIKEIIIAYFTLLSIHWTLRGKW